MARARSRDPLWFPDISAMTNGRCPGPTMCLPIRTSRIRATYAARSGSAPASLSVGVGEEIAEDQHARQTAFAVIGARDLGVGDAVLAQRLPKVASRLFVPEGVNPVVVSGPPPLHVDHVPDPNRACIHD